MPVPERCPCDSGRPYVRCCGPLHTGREAAPTAEALMRSRYCAFVLELSDYLRASWHPSTRPPTLELGTPGAPALRWLGLRILDHVVAADGAHAEVEFIARHRQGGGPAGKLHERSRFVREHGQWFYVDGDQGRSDRSH